MQADGIDEGAVDVENDRSDQTQPSSDHSDRRNIARQPLPGCLVIEDVGRTPFSMSRQVIGAATGDPRPGPRRIGAEPFVPRPLRR
jgi:hypothetical protein